MFTNVIRLVLYPIEQFQGMFLTHFVLFCLIMWLFNLVMKGFFTF